MLYQYQLISVREEQLKYHYDNIAQLKLDIISYDEQIRKDSKVTFPDEQDRFPYHRARQSAMNRTVERRHEAVELLQLLQEKWRKIAPVLREESRKLFVLPRERTCTSECASASRTPANPAFATSKRPDLHLLVYEIEAY
jgi:hypothetical protein